MLDAGPNSGNVSQHLRLWHNHERPIVSNGIVLERFMAYASDRLRGARQTHSFLRAMEKVANEKKAIKNLKP